MKNGLIINENGTKCYYLNDLLHREDGPAVEWTDGYKAWLINGEHHREDGPAIEWENGNGKLEYFLNDEKYSKQDYWKEIKKRKSLGYILSNIKKELLK
jgi:hypothetical protein